MGVRGCAISWRKIPPSPSGCGLSTESGMSGECSFGRDRNECMAYPAGRHMLCDRDRSGGLRQGPFRQFLFLQKLGIEPDIGHGRPRLVGYVRQEAAQLK